MTERGDKFTVSEALKLIFDGEKDDVESNRDSGGEFAVEEESENDHVFEEESTDSDIAEPAKETIPTTPVRGRTITRGTARSRGGCRVQRGGRANRSDPPNEDNANYLTSRSGRLWSKTPPPEHRRGPQDIIRHHPKITRDGNITSPLEAFHLFIDIMTIETNREGQRVISLWKEVHPEKVKKWNPITSVEMNAFLCLLLLAGTYRAKLEPLRDMWCSEHGRPIFTATMSVNRFVDILRFLRFDNKVSREHRRASDKLAAISDI